jgi:hypothetical protein
VKADIPDADPDIDLQLAINASLGVEPLAQTTMMQTMMLTCSLPSKLV